MSKYSIYSTREDYQKIYTKIEKLESDLNENFDWKKIKRESFNSLEVLVSILERKLAKRS